MPSVQEGRRLPVKLRDTSTRTRSRRHPVGPRNTSVQKSSRRHPIRLRNTSDRKPESPGWIERSRFSDLVGAFGSQDGFWSRYVGSVGFYTQSAFQRSPFQVAIQVRRMSAREAANVERSREQVSMRESETTSAMLCE